MRSDTRQHTTSSLSSKGIVVPTILRVGVLFSLLIAFCLLTITPVEAGIASDHDTWELEVLLGEDLDGDGYIGEPPKRDPPPIGGPVI